MFLLTSKCPCPGVTEERVMGCRDSVVTLSRLHLEKVGLSAGYLMLNDVGWFDRQRAVRRRLRRCVQGN